MLFHRDETVRTHRHGVDPAAHKELGEFRMIARRLTAQPDFGAGFVRLADDILDHPFHRLVLFVEEMRQIRGIAVDAERELGEIVAADGKAHQTSWRRRSPE